MPNGRVSTKDLYAAVNKLYDVIIGNGEPEKGLCFRQVLIEKELARMAQHVDELTDKLEKHITMIQPLIEPIANKKESWLDNIISFETRDTLVKWGIRLGLMYLVGAEFFREYLGGLQ